MADTTTSSFDSKSVGNEKVDPLQVKNYTLERDEYGHLWIVQSNGDMVFVNPAKLLGRENKHIQSLDHQRIHHK